MKTPQLSAGIDAEAEIAARLRDAVMERRLAPGTKLPEEELADAFNTTRARIRRVLLSLSQEKIVTLFPGRGAFVAAPAQTEASEVIATRLLLEVGILAQRIGPIDPVPAALRDTVAAERAAAVRGDRSEMIRLSGAFHVALAHWLGNAVVAEILGQLVLRTSLIIALYEPSDGTCCLPTDHEALLDALEAKRMAEAADLMNAHLRSMERQLDFNRRPGHRLAMKDVLRAAVPKLDGASHSNA